jgi:hypothetical protein
MVVMNSRYLSEHIPRLPAPALMALGLLLTSLLTPVLSLDQSDHGRQRRNECEKIWHIAVAATGNRDLSLSIRNIIKSSEELDSHDQADGPMAYRVEFMAALFYAVESFTDVAEKNFLQCMSNVADTLLFLTELAGTEPDLSIDRTVLAAASALAVAEPIGPDSVEALMGEFTHARVGIAQLVESIVASRM